MRPLAVVAIAVLAVVIAVASILVVPKLQSAGSSGPYTSATSTQHASVTPASSCSANPFPTTDGSRYPLPPTTQVKSDCAQIGLSVGTRFFEPTKKNDPYLTQKIQIAKDIALGHSSLALQELQNLTIVGSDANDAEALIYLENQTILSHSLPYITAVLGLDFSPVLIGGTHDVLQGAYIAQRQWNNAHQGAGQLQLLLVLANTGLDSTGNNAKSVMQQIVTLSTSKTNPNFAGIIGWEDSASTNRALQALGTQTIPLISPLASGEHIAGPNFFRIVPPDSSQASLAVNFALGNKQWSAPKNVAIITTSNSSATGSYPTDLASFFRQDLINAHVTVPTPYTYTFNNSQTIKNALAQALATKPAPSLIFFSGYARDLQTLLEAQSQSDQKFRNIPIIAGNSASVMNDYTGLPTGFEHTYFTSFASQAYPGYSGLFQSFSDTFRTFTLPTHVTGVDAATILEYDALGVLLRGYQYRQNLLGSITLSQALRNVACQGASGQIAFDASGNPKNKSVLLEHDDIVNNRLLIDSSSGVFQMAYPVPCLDLPPL